MAIGLICRNCGARLKVPESAAGKLGKCPKCKQPIRVPKAIGPDAHFCDACGKSLAGQQDMQLVSGKIYCSECHKKTLAPEDTSGDPILDQIGLNIPGLVVLRGKDQRQMGRVLQDVHARKDFKTKTKKTEKPGEESEPEPEEAPSPEPEQAPEPEPAEEPEEAVEEEAGQDVADGFNVPVEETQEPAEPEEPATEEPTVPEEPEPESTPEKPAAPKKPEPVEPAPKLNKGQRQSDSLLTGLLVEQGVVLEGELELALQYQKGLGKRLIPVLDDLKLTSEEDIILAIAEYTGLDRCQPGELTVAPHVEKLLDDEMIGLYEVVPLTREDDALVAAFPNPLDLNAMKALREALDMRIIPRICTWTQYREARMALKSAATS